MIPLNIPMFKERIPGLVPSVLTVKGVGQGVHPNMNRRIISQKKNGNTSSDFLFKRSE
jgi:hypothetical protein